MNSLGTVPGGANEPKQCGEEPFGAAGVKVKQPVVSVVWRQTVSVCLMNEVLIPFHSPRRERVSSVATDIFIWSEGDYSLQTEVV